MIESQHVESAWFQRLNLRRNKLLSKLASNFNLRHYFLDMRHTRRLMLEHCIMLDYDPELYDDDGDEGGGVTEWWVGDQTATADHPTGESGESAGGAAGGGSGGGGSGGRGGRSSSLLGGVGSRTSGLSWGGATTSTTAVSKRRNLLFMFDEVNHYYPDGRT